MSPGEKPFFRIKFRTPAKARPLRVRPQGFQAFAWPRVWRFVAFCRVVPLRNRPSGSGVIGMGLMLGLGDGLPRNQFCGLRGAGFGLKPGWSLGLRIGFRIVGMFVCCFCVFSIARKEAGDSSLRITWLKGRFIAGTERAP